MTGRLGIEALRAQIRNVRCRSMDGRLFAAESSIRRIFDAQAIKQAVAELKCHPEDRIGLAEAILHKGVITFAILVWMNREDAIVDFRRWEYLESTRLSENAATLFAPSFGVDFVREYSWQFHPHFFHLGDDIEIDERKILPFLRDVGQVDEGGFGIVSRIEVHPLLQNFYPESQKPVVIVRKQLRKQNKSDTRENALFQNEKRSLLLLNSRKHPHIIPFFGAYRYGPDLCFLFPVLEMDLEHFFEREDSRRFGDFEWDFTFVAALQGLSSALSHVHDVRLQLDTEGVDFSGIGYHHDLRPANILVTSKTFVLADFGMGRLKAANELSQTPWKVGAGDYIAPECMDNDFVHQDVGRAIDVWAFGCLVAEVAAFIRAGAQGLRDFSKARLSRPPGSGANIESTYFYDGEGRMKSVVKDWLVGVSRSGAQLPLDGFLLDLVFAVLVPPLERPKIADVYRRLSLLNVRAHHAAALESFDRFFGESPSGSKPSQEYTRAWLARERLKIFGRASGLDDAELDYTRHHSSAQKWVLSLRQIFDALQSLLRINQTSSTPGSANSIITDVARFEVQQPLGPEISLPGDAASLVADIQKRVRELWNLLPNAQLREAESEWADTMRRQDGLGQYADLEQVRSSVMSDGHEREDGVLMVEQGSHGMSGNTKARNGAPNC
ncbi:MAG: hypothetical protein Q9195_003349 [Heterodermia aff. obscurata]